MAEPNIPVVVRLPPELRDAVKKKAKSEDRSMAQAMRFALRAYVDEGKKR